MTSIYVEIGIDQHWHIEAEGLDAVGDLPDLLLAVAPRVGRVRFQLVDRPVDDQHLMREIGRPAARRAKVLHQRVHFLGWGDPATRRAGV